MAWISEEIPGQKMEDSALAVIADVPWAFCTSDQVTDCREARAQAQDACREFSTVVAAS